MVKCAKADKSRNTATIIPIGRLIIVSVLGNSLPTSGMNFKKDVVIGISTSGNSPNVIEAMKMSKMKGAKTIGLTGGNGGKLAKVADLALIVPSDSTPRIQEAHITIGHIVCELVERELSGTG